MSKENFNYEETFRYMAIRRFERRRKGVIPNGESRAMAMLLSIGMVVFGISNIILENRAPIPNAFDLKTNVAFSTLGSVVWIAQHIITPKTAVSILVIGLFISIIGDLTCIRANYCADYRFIVTITTTSILFLCILFNACRRGILTILTTPLILKHIDYWCNIQQTCDMRHYQYTYNPNFVVLFLPWGSVISRMFRLSKRTFGYSGETDAAGRPHGEGVWNDSSYHGEILSGSWRHGIPIAPFRAIDYTTAYTFQAVRVAYAHNRAESIDQYWYRCIQSETIMWGVCSVECSTAGKFYKHLPKVQHVTGPWSNVDDTISALQLNPRHEHALTSVTITAGRENLQINGVDTPNLYPRKKIQVQLLEDAIALGKHGLCAKDAHEQVFTNVMSEIVVFIHGFNSSVSDALKRVGQLWTLGDFCGPYRLGRRSYRRCITGHRGR